MGIWRWIDHEGRTLRNIGILRDGTLVTGGYPEELVRAAIAAAKQRQHERRSNSAKKAAETKRRRRELRMNKIVALVINGQQVKPAARMLSVREAACRRAIGHQGRGSRMLAGPAETD